WPGFLPGRSSSPSELPEDASRRKTPRFHAGNCVRNLKLVGKLEAMAVEKHCTPAQLALAWLLAQGEDIVPIPGSKRRTRLEENAASTNVTLTAAEMRRIAAVAPQGVAAGQRHPAVLMT